MDIRRNDSSQPNPLRYDLTRPNRESIKERQPLDQPVKTDANPSLDPETLAKHVRAARDAYRDQRQVRIANARAEYTERTAPRRAQQVFERRETYRAELKERAQNAAGAQSSDSLDISGDAKQLVDRALSIAGEADTSRAERLSEIKARFEQGRLSTDELIARAAHRMLGGE
jgi:anti-sigma28 factor (negative regulator of flagellin synthesis)